MQLLDIKQLQGFGRVTAWLADGGWHSETLIPFSEQARRQWQFFSCILCLTEKNAQRNKNERYVLQNRRMRNLVDKRTCCLKVALASWFVKKVFVNPTFLLPHHKTWCLLIQTCCQHTTAVCFCLFLDVSVHLLWPVCKSLYLSHKFLPE